MLKVQEFLLNGGTLEELEKKYAIKAKRHLDYPNLVLLKYDQLESPFSEEIVRECRGIILDSNNSWTVVSRAFDKFFNCGEGHAAKVDWSTARVQEKVDGSLCVMYSYHPPGAPYHKWYVATSGSPDATGPVHDSGLTFKDLFWNTYEGQRAPFADFLPKRLYNPDWCYIFELTSPYNRIVVPHTRTTLTLLAIRNRVTGEWIDYSRYELATENLNPVKEYPLSSLEECLASFEHFSGAQQEGYVVVDAQGNRVKIKHPSYVALHHLKDGFGARRIVELLQAGEETEVLTYFPEFKEDFESAKQKYEALVQELEAAYNKYKDIPVQKDFALSIQGLPYTGVLFSLRAGRIKSVRAGLADVATDSLVRSLGLKATTPAIKE